MLKILNYTSHPIWLDGIVLEPVCRNNPPRLKTPRVNFVESILYEGYKKIDIAHYNLYEMNYLPAPEKDTLYVVSRELAQYLPNRLDILCPDTTKFGAIRDNTGKIIGVSRLSSYSPMRVSDNLC